MTQERIQAVSDAYLASIGNAFYHFTWLEKMATDLVELLDYKNEFPLRGDEDTVSIIIRLNDLVERTKTNDEIKAELQDFCKLLDASRVGGRDKLLHSRPFTSAEGESILNYSMHGQNKKNLEESEQPALYIEWTADNIKRYAQAFQDVALLGRALCRKIEKYRELGSFEEEGIL